MMIDEIFDNMWQKSHKRIAELEAENERLAAVQSDFINWLVDEVGYPFNMTSRDFPATLYEPVVLAWQKKDGGDFDGGRIEDYWACCVDEAGWTLDATDVS
jgi:hypothetical protein